MNAIEKERKELIPTIAKQISEIMPDVKLPGTWVEEHMDRLYFLATWRVNCSEIEKIVTHLPELTLNQQVEMERLSEKESLTDKQAETLKKLKDKADPDKDILPDGAITFANKKYNKHVWDIPEERIESKYTEKGKLQEDDSLELLGRYLRESCKLNVILLKNENKQSNDYAKGYRDSQMFGQTAVEVKTPWSKDTFDAAQLDKHYWQAHGYMDIGDMKHCLVAYCLVDAPPAILYSEFKKQCYYQGVIDETSDKAMEIELEIERRHTFPQMDVRHKVKTMLIDRHEKDIQNYRRRVEMVRAYMIKKYVKEFHFDFSPMYHQEDFT